MIMMIILRERERKIDARTPWAVRIACIGLVDEDDNDNINEDDNID